MLSTQHHPDISQKALRAAVRAEVIDPVLEATGLDLPDVKFYINPAGPFVTGGPKGDAGLTGRKIIIDTYGGASRHGGGAFSGKDPSKVDRSAAYAMRWVAKNAVAAGLADRLEVQVAYAIGKAKPGRALRRDLRHRRASPTRSSPARSSTCSTCARRRSSISSTCCARSTRRRPPTATSAASCPTSRGSAPTASTICAQPPGCEAAPLPDARRAGLT